MTYPERVIGFDCREMWLPPDISDPYNILWRRDITRRLSVLPDGLNWLSAFRETEWEGERQRIRERNAESYLIPKPPDYHTYRSRPFEFWEDFTEMKAFLLRKPRLKPSWLIAITVVETPVWTVPPREDYFPWNHRPGTVLEAVQRPDPAWNRLGYDVQDDLQIAEGLAQGTYHEPLNTELCEKWGPHLNTYHLFEEQQPAVDLADWWGPAESRLYWVFGLYYLQDFPEP
ncbi:MAG TPA: hypothetical protein PLQ56_13915 [Aggregatilineales bacterium]|nr:hypothetical protein [Aggregatilineales bacterium]